MSKVRNLPELTTLAPDDLLYTVDASVGVNGGRKVTAANLKTSGRVLAKGMAFFGSVTAGDKISSIVITDDDNILGYGQGFVVKTIHDSDLPEANMGWFVPPSVGYLEVSALKAFRFIPSGLYLKVSGEKSGLLASTLYVNLHWGVYTI